MIKTNSIILIIVFIATVGMAQARLFREERMRNPFECGYGYFFSRNGCEECGLSEVQPNVKIVGGLQAEPFSWPSQVLILKDLRGVYTVSLNDGTQIRREIAEKIMCGGTLINSQTVLTAAHCLSKTFEMDQKKYELKPTSQYPTFESRLTVFLGLHSIDNLDAAIKIGVAEAITHPQFNSDSLLNDIALLILTNPVKSSYNIKPACLPQYTDSIYPGFTKTVYAAGWGAIFEQGPTDSSLNNVKLMTYNSDKCFTVSMQQPKIGMHKYVQFILGNLAGGQDTCQGDSGGGLYSRSQIAGKVRNEVVGIISYGVGCARVGLPGIYIRTSYYLDWIKANWRVSRF